MGELLRLRLPLCGTAIHPPAFARLDRFSRRAGCLHAQQGKRLFENTRRATFVRQRYAVENPRGFQGYGEHCSGITASEGPGPSTLKLNGIERSFEDYGRAIIQPRNMRISVLSFAVAAFVATGIAGAFGAFLNKYAPIRGGDVIILMQEEVP